MGLYKFYCGTLASPAKGMRFLRLPRLDRVWGLGFDSLTSIVLEEPVIYKEVYTVNPKP